MNTLVTCDDVFETLTRGPFPAGQANASDVESHLRACHDCRQLAEALRPAVGLFHEAMSIDPRTESLPAYRGVLPETNSRSAEPWRAGSLRPTASAARRYWAAAAFLLVCAMGSFSVGYRWKSQDSPQRAPSGQLATVPTFSGSIALAALDLPRVCVGPAEENSAYADYRYQCCTKCHTATRSKHLARHAILTLASSCGACHTRDGPGADTTADNA